MNIEWYVKFQKLLFESVFDWNDIYPKNYIEEVQQYANSTESNT